MKAINLKSNIEATQYSVSFGKTKKLITNFANIWHFYVAPQYKWNQSLPTLFTIPNHVMGYNFQRDAESPKHPPCNCPTELQLQTHDIYLVFQCSGYIKGNRKICWNSNFNISDVFQTFQNFKSETFRTNQRNSSLIWFLLIEWETGIRIAKAREFLLQKSYQPKRTSCWSFLRFSRHQDS